VFPYVKNTDANVMTLDTAVPAPTGAGLNPDNEVKFNIIFKCILEND
jgi:hypothetical protein